MSAEPYSYQNTNKLRRSVGYVAVLAVLLAAGCASDLRDIDAKTDALIKERLTRIGATSSRTPERGSALGEAGPAGAAALNKAPGTTNPEAGALSFTPRSPERGSVFEATEVQNRLAAYANVDPNAPTMTLVQAFQQAQLTGRDFLNAEEEYILAAIRLLIQRHNFDPRFFNETTIGVSKTDTPGDARQRIPLQIMNELGVRQRLPDGGELAARLIWDATEALRQSATERYEQASSLVLSGRIPLLRGAGAVAREDLIQAERELIYAARTFEDFRRRLLVDVASDYFDLVRQIATIRNQERQLESLKRLQERTGALVEAGRLPEFQKNIAASNVLTATSSLANQRERFILTLDRFKVRLGLDISQALLLDSAILNLPEPDTTPQDGARLALEYRLDLQTRRDRVDDQRRAVANAKNSLLPDAELAGSITPRTRPDAREGGFVYEPTDIIYEGGVTFSLPLDRENERLGLRQAQIRLAQSQRELDRFRDEIVIDVRARVRELDRARFNLQLAEQSVTINRRRLEEQELKKDEVTAQQVVETENELLAAENARDQAVTDVRNAVLAYLLATGQLRVARDGTLEMLPGMESAK